MTSKAAITTKQNYYSYDEDRTKITTKAAITNIRDA